MPERVSVALAELTGLRFPTGGLEAAAARTRQRIDDLVAQNPEHAPLSEQEGDERQERCDADERRGWGQEDDRGQHQ